MSRPSMLPTKLTPVSWDSVGLDAQLVALPRLLSDVEEPDLGVIASHGVLGIHRAEVGELHQMLGLATDVGSGVQ